MKEISVQELKQKKDSGEDFQLIDVRESYEYDQANLGGELVPLSTILTFKDKIRNDVPVIIHCRSGARSATAVRTLENQFGFNNLYNLTGGIMAYARDIDNNLEVS